MPKIPIRLGTDTWALQEFADGDERVVKIDDRFYSLWTVPNSDLFYTMVRIGNHQRSIQGTHDRVLEALIRIHKLWRDYEGRCRSAKDSAQRDRDRLLNDLTESFSK